MTKRNLVIKVRVTPDEKALIVRKAGTVASGKWLRTRGIGSGNLEVQSESVRLLVIANNRLASVAALLAGNGMLVTTELLDEVRKACNEIIHFLQSRVAK